MRLIPTFLLATGAFVSLQAAEPARSNIIMIFTDDHGWADIGGQGIQKDIRTPNIDSLVAGGLLATNGYVTGMTGKWHLGPPGIETLNESKAAKAYFDFYLDGKSAAEAKAGAAGGDE